MYKGVPVRAQLPARRRPRPIVVILDIYINIIYIFIKAFRYVLNFLRDGDLALL